VQIKAFAAMPDKKLVIVGSYEKGARQFEAYKKYIDAILPANVELRHWVPSSELSGLYAHCTGFITTSHDEDFGMTAVEAMASGKPVIAPNEGGYKETVIDGKTGALIDGIDAEKLAAAVKKIDDELRDPETLAHYRDACLAQAKKFDTGIFISKIREMMRP
jgi:glycosyltransferase involved in cell wall biosynthesis